MRIIITLLIISIQILCLVLGVKSAYEGHIGNGLILVGINSFFIAVNIINLINEKE